MYGDDNYYSASPTYGIVDGDGNMITTGVSEGRIHTVAQKLANERGESVWYFQTGDADAEQTTEVKCE